MPTFKYKIKGKDGTITEGTTEAPDRFAVYRQIRKEGSTIVSVSKENKKRFGKFLNLEYLNSLIGSIKMSEKIILARNLSAMINAGLVLSRALSVMERQSKNPAMKRVLVEINKDIKGGGTFHEALKKFPKVFSPLFVSMVHSGEEGGSLANSLSTIANQMDKAYVLKKKIKGAMLYPTIIMIAMIIIGILMLIFVVPTLTSTFEELGTELPASTQFIISISDFLKNNTITSIVAVLLVIISFVAGLRTTRGRRAFEFFILHMPIIGNLVKETNSARTTRTFSSLLKSGVDIIEALSITRDVLQNSYYKEVLEKAKKEIQKGAPIAKVFSDNDHLYPVLVAEIISVGEETGNLSEMLNQIADFYEREVEQKTNDMSTIIEPFLMIIIGVVVGFFAISMIAPIYSLSDSI